MHPADVQSSSELYHLSEFGAMVVGRTTSERLAVDHRSPPLALALVLYRRGRQCSECSCSKMSPQQLPQVVGCCEESCGTLIMARLTKRSRSRCRKPSQKKSFCRYAVFDRGIADRTRAEVCTLQAMAPLLDVISLLPHFLFLHPYSLYTFSLTPSFGSNVRTRKYQWSLRRARQGTPDYPHASAGLHSRRPEALLSLR